MKLGRRRLALLGVACLGLLLPRLPAEAQTGRQTVRNEAGLPEIQNFGPRDYGAAPQNTAIAQDSRGVIYVANDDGILTYDGVRWRLIRTANRSPARSLEVDEQDRVFVGAVGELGYLEPDETGTLRYVSMLDQVPEAQSEFSDVWDVFATRRGIIFRTYDWLARFHQSEARSWIPKTYFHRSFEVNGRIFVREHEHGLKELLDDELRLTPEGRRFADERIYAILPHSRDADTVIVVTRTQGLYLLDESGLRSFPTEVDEELAANQVRCGTTLDSGRIVLGTWFGGAFLLEPDGRLARQLTWEHGLLYPTVRALFPDREGGLWLGLDRGLARIHTGSALSLFDERLGLQGSVSTAERHRGRLVAGTSQGLFVLEQNPEPRFRPDPKVTASVTDLLSLEDGLLVATATGVILLGPNGSRRQVTRLDSRSLLESEVLPDLVFVGLADGLTAIRRDGTEWVETGPFSTVEGAAQTMVEMPDGRLWLGTRTSGALRLTWSAGGIEEGRVPSRIEKFDLDEGLPSSSHIQVARVGDDLLVGTRGGVYRFDEANQRFGPDPRFADLLGGGQRWVTHLQEDGLHRIWMSTVDNQRGLRESGVVERLRDGTSLQPNRSWQYPIFQGSDSSSFGAVSRQTEDLYVWDPRPLRDMAGASTRSIHIDGDGVVWLSSSEGLFRLDSVTNPKHELPFRALIRRVRLVEGRRDEFFGGSGRPTARSVDFADNAIRFEYAAPYYSGSDPPLFQVQLAGHDEDWSAWSSEAYREYTNLREGGYRFRVRAKNLYGTISDEASYSFRVLPPWFRTIWAYLAYVASASFLAWGLVHWRVRRSEAEKRELEAVVASRTSELQAKNQQLVTLAAIVKSVNERVDLEELLDAILRECHKILGMERGGALVLAPDDPPRFEFRAAHGWDLSRLAGVVFSPEEMEARYTRGTEEVSEDIFVVRDVEGRAGGEKFRNFQTAAVLLVLRVRVEGRIEGYLVFANHSDPLAFDHREIGLLEGLREHFLSAFQKARARRLLEDTVGERTAELRKKNEQLETLTSIVKSVNERLDLDSLLAAILRECRVIYGVERAAALVRVPGTSRFAVRAATGWKPGSLGSFNLKDGNAELQESGLTEEISEDIYLIRGDAGWPKEAVRAGHLSPESRLVLRIRVEGRVEGYLLFANYNDPHAFDDRDFSLLQGLREHFVSAFQKAQAHRMAEEDRAKAEAANRAKSDFLANMSHELRTPLNSILGFTQLMDRRTGRDEEDRRHLERILMSGEHLLRLINDVLSLSKIEAGHLRIDPQPFDPFDFLRSLEDIMRPVCEGKRVELRFVVDTGWPPVVLGDEGRLRQILLNLLGNAAKFTSEGHVTLSARWNEGRASFSVSDTGPGIDPAEQASLFEAFSQTATGREIKEGSGLGLAVSRQLARAMGGDVTMVSLPGRGSTFTAEVELPRAPNEPATKARERRRVTGLAQDQTPPRILVVDDREDSRELLAGLLRSAGFEVRTEPDGLRGVEAWETWRPDLIWVDQRMPGLDGIETTLRIREQEQSRGRSRVPILALSASALDHEREKLRAAGCDDFVPKPFTAETIFAKIAQYLEVGYAYEEEIETAHATDKNSNAEALGLRLQDVPRPWLSAFEKLLSLGEVQAASRMAEDLSDQELASSLEALLGSFRLDELEAALWDALGKTTHS